MTLNVKGGDINQNFIMRKTAAQYLVYDFGNFFCKWNFRHIPFSAITYFDYYFYSVCVYRASCTSANFRHLLLLLLLGDALRKANRINIS